MRNKKYTETDLTIIEWKEAVRKRPAMYIGSTGIKGFVNILEGFFDDFFSYVDSSRNFKATSYSFELTDEQSGIFTFNNFSSRIPSRINENLQFGNFYFSILNAMSEEYDFTLFDEKGKVVFKQFYQKGIIQTGEANERVFAGKSIEIKFKLDKSVWETFSFNPHFLQIGSRKSRF